MSKKRMAPIGVAALMLLASNALAGGWANTGSVTRVEVVRGQGTVVWGSFGNPNACTRDQGFWIKIEHPQYDELYGLAVAAMVSGLRLTPYLSACESIGWHGGTWNVVTGSDAMFLDP